MLCNTVILWPKNSVLKVDPKAQYTSVVVVIVTYTGTHKSFHCDLAMWLSGIYVSRSTYQPVTRV